MNLIILFSGQGLQKIAHINQLQHIVSEQDWLIITNAIEQFSAIAPLDSLLFNNLYAQPLIFIIQYYRWQYMKRFVETPLAFAGYSLGEATAFCCSSILDFRSGMDVIASRARYMQEAVKEDSGLISLQGLTQSQILPLMKEFNIYPAIKVHEDKFILGGSKTNLDKAIEQLKFRGAQNIQNLSVSVPSHTPLLDEAANNFADYLKNLALPSMTIPVISASDGIKYSAIKQAKDILCYQINHTLDWYQCMQNIEEYRPDVVLEIGPGNALARMMNNFLPHIPCRSFDDFQNPEGLLCWLEKHK